MITEIFWYLLPGKLLGIMHDYKQIFFLLMPHRHIHHDFPKKHVFDNYVIFRMDDVQDYWVQAAQHALMDLFISKNQNLSLGLVMNGIGNDSELVEKVREGNRKGLFELCLHGWNHVIYPKLDEKEQEHSLLDANEKMRTLFGISSSVFIAPYGLFDKSTLKIMSNIGLRILSANSSAELSFNKNKSTYITKERLNLNKAYQMTYDNAIYHIPITVPFKLILRGNWVEVPIEKVIDQIIVNVAKYGYAVVAFHPQEFVQLDKNGNFTNIVQERDIKAMSRLIDSLLSKNLRISSFSGITETIS
jgi:peptidoglycan/xylan/chitin deacetylase (PgdA/CDA1 family)